MWNRNFRDCFKIIKINSLDFFLQYMINVQTKTRDNDTTSTIKNKNIKQKLIN